MKIEDIDREFRELAKSLKEAQQAFRSGNFAQAEPLYKRALELTERSYGEDHADTCVCVGNLADTYYGLRKYKDAVPLFRRLLIMKEKQFGPSHAEVAAVLFKLAKTYEKLGQATESESIYRRALRVGEQAYGKESTFVATILESFSAMLRRAQIRLPEAEQMEERVRDIREKIGNPNRVTTNLLGQLAASIPPGSEEAQQLTGKAQTGENHFDTGRLRSLKSRGTTLRDELPAPPGPGLGQPQMLVLIGFLAFILMGATGAIAWYLTHNQNQPDAGNTAAWQQLANMIAGRKQDQKTDSVPAVIGFISPDQQETVTLVDKTHALMSLHGRDLKGTYNDEGTRITFTPDSQSITYTYQKTASGLVNPEDGCTLYASDAPENLIIDKMKVLAHTSNMYYKHFGQYSSRIDVMLHADTNLQYKNPWTGEPTIPVKKNILGYDESTADMNLNDFTNMQSTIRALGVWHPEVLQPGMIEYYRAPAGSEGDMVFIRGTDRNGNLLRSSRPGMCFLIVCSGGRSRI
ncbi:MAG TPA: tetratricopeptide repeat protein [Planktothrix sp.]|jgi:tetratricopeptide (TPR) repeat protein